MPVTPAAKALLDTFEHIVVINLSDRGDRRREIDAELRRAGLSLSHPSVELFTAQRPTRTSGFPSLGAHGAFDSHLGVMKRMVEHGWNRVLVLEDDMAFSQDFAERLPLIAQSLQERDWAMFYGHPGDLAPEAKVPDANGLITFPPEEGIIRLHFFGFTTDFARTAIPMLEAMLTRPEGSPEGGPMHVDGAINWVRVAHPELTALGVTPQIARQRPSRSDIAETPWFDRVPVLRELAAFARRLRKG
jgi:glycosyl transferase family 25